MSKNLSCVCLWQQHTMPQMASSKRIQLIRRLKQSGETYRQIASRFGVSPQAVQFLIRVRSEKPKRCSRCGKKPRKNQSLHGHHTNYVREKYKFLCASCHTKEHAPFSSAWMTNIPLSKSDKRFQKELLVSLQRGDFL